VTAFLSPARSNSTSLCRALHRRAPQQRSAQRCALSAPPLRARQWGARLQKVAALVAFRRAALALRDCALHLLHAPGSRALGGRRARLALLLDRLDRCRLLPLVSG